jgi:hypothetical protein
MNSTEKKKDILRRGSSPKPSACKANTLILICNKMMCLSLKSRDRNFTVRYCHIAFKFHSVFRGNNASAKISTKNIFVLKYRKDSHSLLRGHEFSYILCARNAFIVLYIILCYTKLEIRLKMFFSRLSFLKKGWFVRLQIQRLSTQHPQHVPPDDDLESKHVMNQNTLVCIYTYINTFTCVCVS